MTTMTCSFTPRYTLPFLSKTHGSQILSLAGLDPLDSLQLWIDHERPSLTVCENRSVLGRHAIRRETFVLPACDCGIVRKQGERI